MAPHDTNTPRQVRRHRGPLIGMAVCVALVLLGFFFWVGRATQGRDAVPATEEPPAATAPVTVPTPEPQPTTVPEN